MTRLDRLTSPTAALARAARAMTELEIDDFADLVGTPALEVEAWEQGVRAPPPIGVRLLTLILETPAVCLSLLELPRTADPGRCTA